MTRRTMRHGRNRRNPDELDRRGDFDMERPSLPRELHVKPRDLPRAVYDVLKDQDFNGGRDIVVLPTTKYSPRMYAGDGERSFVIAVEIATGRTKETIGDWGGGSPVRRAQVDADDSEYRLPVGGAVVQGTRGGRGTWATVLMHPDDVRLYLATALGESAAVPILSERLTSVLNAIGGLTSAGRKDEFDRAGWGRYGGDNRYVRELAALGLVSVSDAGAVRVTTAGKAARSRR